MENSSTLMGKYGEEGDRLIFKILNSGDYLKKVDLNSDLDAKKMIPKISDKALRYDLTVPCSLCCSKSKRYYFSVQTLPIQPVWRADRPKRTFSRILSMRCRCCWITVTFI